MGGVGGLLNMLCDLATLCLCLQRKCVGLTKSSSTKVLSHTYLYGVLFITIMMAMNNDDRN